MDSRLYAKVLRFANGPVQLGRGLGAVSNAVAARLGIQLMVGGASASRASCFSGVGGSPRAVGSVSMYFPIGLAATAR